ncbi:NADH dehydrogenase [ubiquinone] 1 beta subcomplex subunit 9 [Aspergillus puulaauensis]|uniref:NADH dehydrogenase [ubiquinone] 1 beta subcomplex subunit 9 n=1 Tax=Aspergillus puulaauensis TaxID=1220207 RepID=A0A7R7XKR0_9EURO|nr:uncharacterized protein APUU_31510S [Aspergillus puulaauensis]BCS23285.1 hypothetical protein APUU_31510S [Aspergillus puulaauensis]
MSINAVTSLYRRSLKLALDWAVHRNVWRGQAVYIRSLFEANKDIRDPRQQKVCDDPAAMKSFDLPVLCSTPRDGKVTRDVETPRPLPRTYSPRWYVYV